MLSQVTHMRLESAASGDDDSDNDFDVNDGLVRILLDMGNACSLNALLTCSKMVPI